MKLAVLLEVVHENCGRVKSDLRNLQLCRKRFIKLAVELEVIHETCSCVLSDS